MAQVRVAAHVHSDWSYDGRWRLTELARAFGRRRYDIVLMAEHDRGFDSDRWLAYRAACAHASGDGALLMPGIEYSDAANAVHVAVWGDLPFLGEGLETRELLQRVAQEGGVAVLAHPGRRDVLGKLDPAWTRNLLGLELWNRKYDGYAPNQDAARLLRQRPDLVPFVGLDFHSARQFHPLAMVLELDGPLNEASVHAALRSKRCRPTAFRLPAQELARGRALKLMRGLERARKAVAMRLRRARALRAKARSAA